MWAIVTALRPSVVRPSSVNIFKRLLLSNHWAYSHQTSWSWSLGRGTTKLLKWFNYVIQDGRHLKIAQILKKSSSHEPPVGFRRNLVGIVVQWCSSRIAKTVTLGSKMGVARGVKWGSNLSFGRIWSCHISNRSYWWSDHSGAIFVEIAWLCHPRWPPKGQKVVILIEIFKILLHINCLAHDGQTSQLCFMGEAFSKLLKWFDSVIQDGRHLKIAQIHKKNLLLTNHQSDFDETR